MLAVKQITGGYTKIPIIKQVDFSVEAGELVALIGLNGAGKSTTIKHIMGLLTPYSGSITVNGKQLKDSVKEYRQQMTYIPETPVLYAELTLKEHIEVTGLAYGLDRETALQNALPYLQKFRLDDKLDWFPIHFSKGMKQKVMIVCALMIDVALYVIDEPFLGLDPIAIKHLLQMIDDKKKQGSAILMSTHILSTAEKKCDKFIFMHQGTVKAFGTLQQLQEQLNNSGTLDDLYIQMAEEE